MAGEGGPDLAGRDAGSVETGSAAVEALKRFGLSTYEARTFVALQKLETGSASEVAEIADVPRSQVYGATDELKSRGLIGVQQGTPTRYRPVGIEEAKQRLYAGLRATGDAAFAYIESVRGEHASGDREGEAIWTVEGPESVAARCVSLVDDAVSEVTYATGDPDAMEGVLDALGDARDRGVAVTVVSAERTVLDAVDAATGDVATWYIPDERDPGVSTGRVLLVDGDTLLLSVTPAGAVPHVSAETGFWSTGTAFATLLVAIVREWFEGVSTA